MCFVFRQHKAVADVLRCVDVDNNGKYNFLFFFSEGEARRSLRSELEVSVGEAHFLITASVSSTRSHDVWNIDLEKRFHGRYTVYL
jgi:hypothetical protein